MKIGDLVIIGEKVGLIVAKEWDKRRNEWHYSIQYPQQNEPMWLIEDIAEQVRRDYIWWTKNALDNNIRNGYIIDKKGG